VVSGSMLNGPTNCDGFEKVGLNAVMVVGLVGIY
jgi:hypothetical protein